MKRCKMLFRKFAFLVPAILILSGCYLPASFDAEMELSRTGLYKMSFDGYIVDLNIYKSMRSKKLKVDSPEFKEKIQKIIDDFERDTSTKSVSYFKQGAFKVNWSKGGDIIKARQVMFFRRNENMLSITYDKKKATIMLKGKYIKSQDAARLEQLGLTVQGVIRIKTDAKVVTHNAQKIWNEGSVKFYGWRLNSIRDKPPLLIVSLGG
jgi:hypothetical protein